MQWTSHTFITSVSSHTQRITKLSENNSSMGKTDCKDLANGMFWFGRPHKSHMNVSSLTMALSCTSQAKSSVAQFGFVHQVSSFQPRWLYSKLLLEMYETIHMVSINCSISPTIFLGLQRYSKQIYISVNSISCNALIIYLRNLTSTVEIKIKPDLLGNFSFFDGWTPPSTYYTAI